MSKPKKNQGKRAGNPVSPAGPYNPHGNGNPTKRPPATSSDRASWQAPDSTAQKRPVALYALAAALAIAAVGVYVLRNAGAVEPATGSAKGTSATFADADADANTNADAASGVGATAPGPSGGSAANGTAAVTTPAAQAPGIVVTGDASNPAAQAPGSATTTDTSTPALFTDTDIVIPLSGVSETATFYPAEVGGTRLEVLAVKAPDGTVRTAFNTCQVCYDSGRGYYKQSGDVLVCQNCGNRFKMSQVEVLSGGCNPVPIFAENKTVDDDNITIHLSYLQEATRIFANWRGEY
ncbi:MAG: DUF2318 domain-containing protein [Lachnospiraceae bacterium]|jgi:hypothetical protein|nr:DUF2318 domain-containing protein [Lachnospiraceae bacterium]